MSSNKIHAHHNYHQLPTQHKSFVYFVHCNVDQSFEEVRANNCTNDNSVDAHENTATVDHEHTHSGSDSYNDDKSCNEGAFYDSCSNRISMQNNNECY